MVVYMEKGCVEKPIFSLKYYNTGNRAPVSQLPNALFLQKKLSRLIYKFIVNTDGSGKKIKGHNYE